MILNRLAVLAALAGLLLAIPVPLDARTRKGDQLMKEGREAEARKEYDKALELYEKALQTDPMDAAYSMSMNRVRFQAGQMHLSRGKDLRAEGKLEEALIEFQKSFAIDPSSTIAEQEMRRTVQLINERDKAPADKKTDYNLSPAQKVRQEAEERAASIRGVPELRPVTPMITNLKIVNQSPKVLFETIGKLAGVNILIDSEYQDQGKRYSLDLNRTTLSEALDYASLLTKTFWKPLSTNAIFITADTVPKRRDYEEHVTRVFYLQNITTPQELQEVMTAMRQVTDVRKIFPFNSQSALVVRGTADQMALAEKVILDLDKPKPEVVVDVLVFEASRTKTRELGMAWAGGGLSIPITFTPGGTPPSSGSGSGGSGGGSNSIPLDRLNNLSSNDWSVVLPSATLTALLSDGRTRIMQSPQVRATDGQKASLRLGDRYPYATGSFQPGVGAVGVSPLVSTQFQFADVGVNVDVTPRIHGSDEVSMQVELEISNIKERINVGGLEQPVIGQRKVSHIIRVKEGQATLIGGLMLTADRVTKTGIPGLANLPGIGWLFGSEKIEKTDNDLLVVLLPHIVRYPELRPENLKAVASGTDTIYKISYAPKEEAVQQPPVPQTGPDKPQQVPFAVPIPPNPAAAQTPAAPETKPAGEQPAAPTAPPPPPPGQTIQATSTTPPTAQPRVVISATPQELPVNAVLTVRVNVENVKDLFAAPMRIAFNEKALKLVEIRRGPFLGGDGAQITFNETKVESPGMAIIGMNRLPGSGGISGSGTLATLVFQTLAAGSTEIKLEEVTLRDALLQTIQVPPPSVAVTVK